MADISIKTDLGAKSGSIHSLLDALTSLSVGNPSVGQLRIGLVDSVNLSLGKVKLNLISDKVKDVEVQYPGFMINTDGESGLWYGLNKGDLVICGIGYGNTYTILNKIASGISLQQKGSLNDATIFRSVFNQSGSSPSLAALKDLKPGNFLMKSGNSKMFMSSDSGIFVGNLGYGSINFDVYEGKDKKQNFTSIVSNQYISIKNSGYEVSGAVLRDKTPTTTGDESTYQDPRFINRWYADLKSIAFDPTLVISEQTINSNKRNPTLTEKRELVYEFCDDFFIESDDKELDKQIDTTGKGGKMNIMSPLTSRRIRKNDAFSLSLVSPNYLIEKIEGTAVDINGNIIDLNRNVLPVGDTTLGTTLTGSSAGYTKLREVHRRGLAFHWELNARKDPNTITPETGSKNDYAKSDDIYKRNRSRMFIDVDKEGQFKINVPASSEIGNVGVLTRYENYTTINPYKKDDNSQPDYDYFIKSDESKTDILLDSYGNGVVSLSGSDKLIAKDRITTERIKLGTMFHDISTTCVLPSSDDQSKNRLGILSGPDNEVLDIDQTKRQILKNTSANSVITKELQVDSSGIGSPNAGGRSGTAVFDGMLNVSVGANTVDRQSLWLDLQGGMVQRIGCDKNGISCATQTDGDFYLQIGGQPYDTDPDTRFDKTKTPNIVLPNANKTQTFEIRVMQGNGPQYARILINSLGIVIASPQNIELRADQDIVFSAGKNVRINGETIYCHSDEFADDLAVPVHAQKCDLREVYEPDPSGGCAIEKPFFGSAPIINHG